MHSIVERHRQTLDELCRRFGVQRLELFGSAVDETFDPERSDIDLLVEFDPAPQGKRADQYFGLLAELERLFERPVDLVESGTVRNPYVLRSIEQTRRPIYVAA